MATTQITTAPFSQQLREATDGAHQAAERSTFVEDLVGERLPLASYARFVRQLHAVYEVLEEESDAAATDPVTAPFLAPELRRVPSLAADLEYLVGPDWAEQIETVHATDAYCARIRTSAEWNGGLVAHHYVRYLGDLSGGQFLGRVVARVYDLPDGHGTSLYRFDDIASPKAFKELYRAQLDAAPWTTDERARIVDEANAAFACNSAIFTAMSAA
ncbi:MAG TPA: biliverdin-producing heme oxygenase [Acidimicrobiia bacterium]|nr:biliverdin-producing heme oxygenase [Acidimicrobiia bacterium]